jgi:hypothetical protein
MRLGHAAPIALLLAGCGSAPLPPPAGPAASPPLRQRPAGVILRGHVRTPDARFPGGLARVDRRARTLELYAGSRRVARAPAGVGPTTVATAGGRFYVTDTVQGALLVFDRTPRLELQRRVYLPGGPYAVAVDRVRRRLWVTLTARNEVVVLAADGTAKLRGRYPTVRAPRAIRVDQATGAVRIGGAQGALQVLRRRTR